MPWSDNTCSAPMTPLRSQAPPNHMLSHFSAFVCLITTKASPCCLKGPQHVCASGAQQECPPACQLAQVVHVLLHPALLQLAAAAHGLEMDGPLACPEHPGPHQHCQTARQCVQALTAPTP